MTVETVDGNSGSDLTCAAKVVRFGKSSPLFAEKCPTTVRWVSFLVACITMSTCASSVFSFYAWQNSMRAKLNQTESESNLVSAFGLSGYAMAFPAGILYNIIGGKFVTLIGGILLTMGYLFLWLGTSGSDYWREVYVENPAIVYLLYLSVGVGCGFTYMAVLLPNAANFPNRLRGVVFGILDAAFVTGPAFFSLVYYLIYANGEMKVGEEGQQDLSGFFLAVSLVMLTGCISSILFVGEIRGDGDITVVDDSSASESKCLIETKREDETPPSKFADYPYEELPTTKVITRGNYILLVMQYGLNSCIQEVWRNNITTYLRSFNMNQYILPAIVVPMVLSVLTHAAGGFISDKIAEDGRMPRSIILLPPYALQTVFFAVAIFYGDQLPVIILMIIAYSGAAGVTWPLTCTIISEMYGTKRLGANWGVAMLVNVIFVFPISLGFSYTYQDAITKPSDIYCYGLHCFTWSYVLFAILSLVGLILAAILFRNMQSNAERREPTLPTSSSS